MRGGRGPPCSFGLNQARVNYGFFYRAERDVCRTRGNRLTSGISELPGSPSESSGVKSYDRRNVTVFFGDFCPSFFLFTPPF